MTVAFLSTLVGADALVTQAAFRQGTALGVIVFLVFSLVAGAIVSEVER